MTRVLVTGITGFIGGYLAKHLLDEGYEVWGLRRFRSSERNLHKLGISSHPRLHLVEGDITDPRSIQALVTETRPTFVHHLAAQSYPMQSWSAPWHTLECNVVGTLNLLEAVRASRLRPRIHIPGSAAQYGSTSVAENPIKETQPFRPGSPYAVSKCAQELLGWQYHASFGLDVILTRSFIHTGPGQGDRCVLQTFSKQMSLIELGTEEPIVKVGNLSPIRDFSDVRDVARAFLAITKAGQPGDVYNVASGRGVKIADLLNLVITAAGVQVEVEVDPTRIRPVDEPILVGDITKLSSRTGWTPLLPIERTVADVLESWREQARRDTIRP